MINRNLVGVVSLSVLLTACVHSSGNENRYLEPYSQCSVHADLNAAELPTARAFTSTKTLLDVKKRALDLESYQTGQVLVVFDIDDTLLANGPNTQLASSAWVNWQEHLTFGGKEDPCRAAENGSDLYNIVSLLYSSLDLIETEASADSWLDELSENGVFTHALTSRSPIDQGSTLRELDDNGLSFNPPPCSEGLCQKPGVVPHNEVEALAVKAFGCEALKAEAKLSGFTGKNVECSIYQPPKSPSDILTTFTDGREVSIANGVMHSEGQNKGVMLELLLGSFQNENGLPIRFEHVLFVDDSEKNISNLHQAKSLNQAGTELSRVNLHLFHYDRTDERNALLLDGKALFASKKELDGLLCSTENLGQYKRARKTQC